MTAVRLFPTLHVIFDFDLDFDLLYSKELNGFKIFAKNVYFKGVCPKCLLNINDNN
ncbi:MAG: hypothetical protein DDT27_01012 [Dehalococcoidia bacterium]|nr:hypothetical protein [Chloroflexota bacterium]